MIMNSFTSHLALLLQAVAILQLQQEPLARTVGPHADPYRVAFRLWRVCCRLFVGCVRRCGRSPSPMNTTPASDLSLACQAAKQRLVSARGDPFLLADWEKVVFLHFLIEPELLRSQVPHPFALELYEGQACISLVALTMRRFRPCRRLSLGWIFRPVREQRFLNLRTYVRCEGEPGALFLRGWLSAPFPMRLPSAMFGLPYSFAALNYEHNVENGPLGGVAALADSHHFGYRAPVSTPLVLEH